jgi:hypothetical protein
MVNILQIKIVLKGSKPPIWREIEVKSDITLGQLHSTILRVMGWHGGHLAQFMNGREDLFIDDMMAEMEGVRSVSRKKISQWLSEPKDKLLHLYDFGDDWNHTIVVKKVLPIQPGISYPRCIDGARACPPEDCGGIWRYMDILEILKDKKHPEYEEVEEWMGKKYDPEKFDIAKVNKVMK